MKEKFILQTSHEAPTGGDAMKSDVMFTCQTSAELVQQ